VTDLKNRLAVLLTSPEGKAMVEEGLKFSTEELQAAFALEEADADQRLLTRLCKHSWREGQTEMTVYHYGYGCSAEPTRARATPRGVGI
jgi:hypothetical protein